MNSLDLNKRITRILNELLDVKGTIQGMVPNSEINIKEGGAVANQLLQASSIMQDVLIELNLLEEEKTSTAGGSGVNIPEIDTSGFLILVARKRLQDIITKFESVKLETIMTGGPLEASLYKVINPSLPETALGNIGKKIEKIYKQIKRRGEGREKIVIIGIINEKVDELLVKAYDALVDRTKKDVVVLQFKSESNLSELSLVKRLLEI